jgi:hypothetical protein
MFFFFKQSPALKYTLTIPFYATRSFYLWYGSLVMLLKEFVPQLQELEPANRIVE